MKTVWMWIIPAGLALGCSDPVIKESPDITDFADTHFVALPDAPEWLQNWPRRKTLVFHWMTEPRSLHPTNGIEVGKFTIFSLIHGYSVYLDSRTLTLQPDVAENMPEISADGLQYTFHIRREAVWDDGSPVTAYDALFTYKANICPDVNNPEMKAYLDYITDVRVVNERSFSVKMKGAYLYNDYIHGDLALLQESLFDPERVLRKISIPELIDKDYAVKFATAEIRQWAEQFNDAKYGTDIKYISGCGPYAIVRWEPEQSITLVRKPNHWTSRVNEKSAKHFSGPDTIILRNMKDETAVHLEMKRQAIDVTTSLSGTIMETLMQDPEITRNYHTAFVPSYSYAFIALNTKPDGKKRKKYFDQVNVRRAFAHLTPVQEIIDVVYNGQAGIMTGPVSPDRKEYLTELQSIPFDPVKAGKLLEQAGWIDTDGDGIRDKMIEGEKVSLSPELAYGSASPVGGQIAEIIADGMKQAGVQLVINPVSSSLLREKGSTHDFDMLMMAFSSSAAPAEDFKQVWHSESWLNQGTNYTGFGTRASDALIDSIRSEMHESKRIEMIRRFQKMVYDEQPWIPLNWIYRKIAIHKRWRNANLYYERPGVLLNELVLPEIPGVQP